MARESDNTLWKILNDKVHYNSRLEDLLGSLGLPGASPKYITPVLSYCLPLVLMAICFLVFLRPRKEVHIHARAALRALLTVVVPTCSLWPSHYIELASIFRSRVDIPLEVIIEDTVNGVLEFCNPVNDLANLIDSGVRVNGHTICINIGWQWWISCFQWWMLVKPKSGMYMRRSRSIESASTTSSSRSPGFMSRLLDWLRGDMPPANSSHPSLPLSPPALASSTSHLFFCIDSLPHGTIPLLNTGCKITLEFTAFSPSLRVLSTAQIISAIPFIMSERSRRRPRSPVSVLQQLSASYGPNLVVDSLSSVSADYEHALRHLYKSSSEERKIREMGVKNLGIKAWRRDLFLVALEAALVRRGWIERWAVQVTVK